MDSDSSSMDNAVDSISLNENLIDENKNQQDSEIHLPIERPNTSVSDILLENTIDENKNQQDYETHFPVDRPNISVSDILLENTNESENVVTSSETFDITPEKNGGVLKRIIRGGEGEESPGYGDKVSVHYTGWLLTKEPKEFDSSRKGEKFEFNLGRGKFLFHREQNKNDF